MEEYFIEEKTTYDIILDVLVFIAVFVVTIFLLLSLAASQGYFGLDIVKINEIYFYVNLVVLLIFVIDLVRLWNQHSGFKDFINHCWLDVLATIPFGLVARAPVLEVLKWSRFAQLSHLAKMQRVSRVSKITRQFKAASHLKKEGEEYKRKHRL